MNDIFAPDNKELRNFALVTGSALVIVFGLFIPWVWETSWLRWPWYTAAILISWGLLHPASLKPIYIVWMKFALVLGWINTRIILGLCFYVIFFPTSLLLKLFGFDPLRRKFDPKATSYRVNSKPPVREHMERPF